MTIQERQEKYLVCHSMHKLPNSICILDIETAKTSFQYPEKSILAVAGIKFYYLQNGKYYSGKYKYFTIDSVNRLEQILKDFPGIIIGHNIFGFDYRVLTQYIDLKSVIEKTVDVQMLLFKKCDELKGLSLAGLCHFNFNKEKTIEGKQVSLLWNKGKRAEVIEYNHNDCKLTKSLWWFIVNTRKLKVVKVHLNYSNPKETPYYDRTEISFTENELNQFLGRSCVIRFNEWLHKKGKYIDIKKNRKGYYAEPQDTLPEHISCCPKCKSKFLQKLDLQEMNLFNEFQMSEGQEADYYAGLRGIIHCQKCGFTFDYQI